MSPTFRKPRPAALLPAPRTSPEDELAQSAAAYLSGDPKALEAFRSKLAAIAAAPIVPEGHHA